MTEQKYEAETETPVTDGPFKAGDVVRCKGSGPSMTVERVKASGICCVWFDKANVCHRETFAAFSLEPSK